MDWLQGLLLISIQDIEARFLEIDQSKPGLYVFGIFPNSIVQLFLFGEIALPCQNFGTSILRICAKSLRCRARNITLFLLEKLASIISSSCIVEYFGLAKTASLLRESLLLISFQRSEVS